MRHPGMVFEEDQKPHNAKVLNREVGRLETSLKAAEGQPIWCFLHYPPLYQGYQCREILGCWKSTPWSSAATATSTAR